MKKLIIWHNLKKDTYYAKVVLGYYCRYELNYVNQYGHKIIYIYDLPYTTYKKKGLINFVLSPLIALLKLITRTLEKITSYL